MYTLRELDLSIGFADSTKVSETLQNEGHRIRETYSMLFHCEKEKNNALIRFSLNDARTILSFAAQKYRIIIAEKAMRGCQMGNINCTLSFAKSQRGECTRCAAATCPYAIYYSCLKAHAFAAVFRRIRENSRFSRAWKQKILLISFACAQVGGKNALHNDLSRVQPLRAPSTGSKIYNVIQFAVIVIYYHPAVPRYFIIEFQRERERRGGRRSPIMLIFIINISRSLFRARDRDENKLQSSARALVRAFVQTNFKKASFQIISMQSYLNFVKSSSTCNASFIARFQLKNERDGIPSRNKHLATRTWQLNRKTLGDSA